jgi:heptosyltransferase-2
VIGGRTRGNPTSPQRILVRLPSWVGDVVMATPALRALRGAHPRARITLEGRAGFEELLQGLPLFDEFLVDPGRSPRETWRRVRILRKRRFDLAVLLPDSPRAALGPFLARVPQRVGFSRDPLRSAMLSDRLRHPRHAGHRRPLPTTERYLKITRRLGCPDAGTILELKASPEARARVDQQLAEHGIASEARLLVVTPGASFGASKLWPAEHFASACDQISSNHKLVTVLAPGPGEFQIASEIASQMQERAIALVNKPPRLADLKALISRSALLLSNDTGPRHIAVALRRPVVVVMGPTNPAHTSLHLERQRVLRREIPCSPCQLKTCPIDHRCMTGLHPDLVITAAGELLLGKAPQRH